MTPSATIPSQTSRSSADALTIRMAVPNDTERLNDLAQLDSARVRDGVPMLVAEIDGELRAALPLDGGRAIADPFHRTAEIVAMLAQRALQLAPPARHRVFRRRRLPRPRAVPGSSFARLDLWPG
jgi:hypothetical protein